MIKQLFFIGSLSILTSLAKAEDREGYYVTLQGDTVKATIKRGGFLSNAEMEYLKVTVKDRSGKLTIFSPKEISGYGFDYEGHYYHFRSKPVEKGEVRFLEISFQTPKAKLFYYRKLQSSGYGSYEERHYTLENDKEQFLFLKNTGNLKKMREKAIAFFQQYPKTVAVIEARFEKKKEVEQDIIEIMKSVNE